MHCVHVVLPCCGWRWCRRGGQPGVPRAGGGPHGACVCPTPCRAHRRSPRRAAAMNCQRTPPHSHHPRERRSVKNTRGEGGENRWKVGLERQERREETREEIMVPMWTQTTNGFDQDLTCSFFMTFYFISWHLSTYCMLDPFHGLPKGIKWNCFLNRLSFWAWCTVHFVAICLSDMF